MTLNKIDVFEKNNEKFRVNVLGFDQEDGVYRLRIANHDNDSKVVNLLLISNEDGKKHYVLIKT